MNLFGKILVVAILLLSIFFLTASMMVFATHRDWKEAHDQLQTQLTDLQGNFNTLQSEKDAVDNTLAMERAARRQALASLESRLQEQLRSLQQSETQLRELQAQTRQQTQTIEMAQTTVQSFQEEAQSLRQEILQLREANTGKLDEIIALTDRLQQAEGTLQPLEQTNQTLRDELGRATNVLASRGLTPFTPVSAPEASGFVTSVSNGRVQVSLGSDDGIRAGHELDIYRGGDYLGRIRVTHAEIDRSVGDILPGAFRSGTIQRGDRVRTQR
jgi:hypothetical protein